MVLIIRFVHPYARSQCQLGTLTAMHINFWRSACCRHRGGDTDYRRGAQSWSREKPRPPPVSQPIDCAARVPVPAGSMWENQRVGMRNRIGKPVSFHAPLPYISKGKKGDRKSVV